MEPSERPSKNWSAQRYIEIRKLFQGKKPRTEILPPLQGRSAFASHTAALRKIIGEML
jgi:hypothetical protein